MYICKLVLINKHTIMKIQLKESLIGKGPAFEAPLWAVFRIRIRRNHVLFGLKDLDPDRDPLL